MFDKTVNSLIIKKISLILLGFCAILLLLGAGLLILQYKNMGVITFILSMLPLGFFLTVISVHFFKKNILMFNECNKSIGMNRFGSNTVDEGKTYYIFNQGLAVAYCLIGLSMTFGSIFAFVYAILFKLN